MARLVFDAPAQHLLEIPGRDEPIVGGQEFDAPADVAAGLLAQTHVAVRPVPKTKRKASGEAREKKTKEE